MTIVLCFALIPRFGATGAALRDPAQQPVRASGSRRRRRYLLDWPSRYDVPRGARRSSHRRRRALVACSWPGRPSACSVGPVLAGRARRLRRSLCGRFGLLPSPAAARQPPADRWSRRFLMASARPFVSVIFPTYNRCDVVRDDDRAPAGPGLPERPVRDHRRATTRPTPRPRWSSGSPPRCPGAGAPAVERRTAPRGEAQRSARGGRRASWSCSSTTTCGPGPSCWPSTSAAHAEPGRAGRGARPRRAVAGACPRRRSSSGTSPSPTHEIADRAGEPVPYRYSWSMNLSFPRQRDARRATWCSTRTGPTSVTRTSSSGYRWTSAGSSTRLQPRRRRRALPPARPHQRVPRAGVDRAGPARPRGARRRSRPARALRHLQLAQPAHGRGRGAWPAAACSTRRTVPPVQSWLEGPTRNTGAHRVAVLEGAAPPHQRRLPRPGAAPRRNRSVRSPTSTRDAPVTPAASIAPSTAADGRPRRPPRRWRRRRGRRRPGCWPGCRRSVGRLGWAPTAVIGVRAVAAVAIVASPARRDPAGALLPGATLPPADLDHGRVRGRASNRRAPGRLGPARPRSSPLVGTGVRSAFLAGPLGMKGELPCSWCCWPWPSRPCCTGVSCGSLLFGCGRDGPTRRAWASEPLLDLRRRRTHRRSPVDARWPSCSPSGRVVGAGVVACASPPRWS